MIRVQITGIERKVETTSITTFGGPVQQHHVALGEYAIAHVDLIFDPLTLHSAGLQGWRDLEQRIERGIETALAAGDQPTSPEVLAEIISGRRIRL